MLYIQYLYQNSHRLQFKDTETSASTTSFRTHDFDHRYLLCFLPILHGRFDLHSETLHHIISRVAILRFWRCVWLHRGGKDEPVWFGVILRYQPPKLLRRRRQHDAFRSLIFWFNVMFPTALTFPGNLCCTPVRGGPSYSPCEPQAVSCSTSWGASKVMTKSNGVIIKHNFHISQQAHKLLQPGTTNLQREHSNKNKTSTAKRKKSKNKKQIDYPSLLFLGDCTSSVSNAYN